MNKRRIGIWPVGPPSRTTAVCLALVVASGWLTWGVSSAAAQLRTRNPGRAGLGKINRQQRQVPKENQPGKPLDSKETPPDRKPNQQGLKDLRSQFTEQELRMVPRGVMRADALIRTFRQLNLSDDQRIKLRDLTRQAGNQIPILNQLHRAQFEALNEAIYGQNFDPKLVEQRAAELAATQAELTKLKARVQAQIRQILTPEQSLKFRELLEQELNRPVEAQPQSQAPPNKP